MHPYPVSTIEFLPPTRSSVSDVQAWLKSYEPVKPEPSQAFWQAFQSSWPGLTMSHEVTCNTIVDLIQVH